MAEYPKVMWEQKIAYLQLQVRQDASLLFYPRVNGCVIHTGLVNLEEAKGKAMKYAKDCLVLQRNDYKKRLGPILFALSEFWPEEFCVPLGLDKL